MGKSNSGIDLSGDTKMPQLFGLGISRGSLGYTPSGHEIYWLLLASYIKT